MTCRRSKASRTAFGTLNTSTFWNWRPSSASFEDWWTEVSENVACSVLSTAVSFSVCKGRSSSRRVNFRFRRLGGLLLANNLSLALCWAPSWANPQRRTVALLLDQQVADPLSKGARAALRRLQEKWRVPSDTVTESTKPAKETRTASGNENAPMPDQETNKDVKKKTDTATLFREATVSTSGSIVYYRQVFLASLLIHQKLAWMRKLQCNLKDIFEPTKKGTIWSLTSSACETNQLCVVGTQVHLKCQPRTLPRPLASSRLVPLR